MKTNTNILRKEVLALEDTRFQLQQSETLSPHRRLSTIGTLPIPHLHFCVPPNPGQHIFSKLMHHNLVTPLANRKNKWESDTRMDGYFVVEIIVILYARFRVIINIVSKKDNNWWHPTMHMPKLHQIELHKLWERKKNRCISNTCTMSLDFFPRWITAMTCSHDI